MMKGHVEAALAHAKRVREIVESDGVPEPPALGILYDDLKRVLGKLDIDFGSSAPLGGWQTGRAGSADG